MTRIIRKSNLIVSLFFFGTCFLLFSISLQVFAGSSNLSEGLMFSGIVEMSPIGPVIFDRVLNAWASLVAAIIIFLLALTYMKGGYLARPILVIGVGALTDAIVGLALPPVLYAEWAWVGSLVLSFCIIIAVFWMERLFRALR